MRAHDLVTHYRDLDQLVRDEIAQIDGSLVELQALQGAAQAEAEAARIDLAAVYLPALDAESLARAEQLTGFRGFSRFKPIEAMAKERLRLEHDIAAVRADPRYVRREYLVGPNGEITRRLAEARDMLAPWDAECARFESIDGFRELLDVRYDTPDFVLRWWQPAYWRVWANGDRVCETLGLADFGDDVLPAWEKVRAPRDEWRAQVQSVERERDEVLGLVRRHDQDLDRLARLPEIYLAECRAALAKHLETADPQLLESWAGEDRGFLVGLRRVAGLAAKEQVFEEMRQGLLASQAALVQRSGKYQRKIAKFSRSKHYYTEFGPEAMDLRATEKVQKLGDKRIKLLGLAKRVERYDDYDRFDLDNPPELWWLEFTGKRPSRYTPRLQQWYDRNPSVVVTHDDDALASAVAVAAADRAFDELGDLS